MYVYVYICRYCHVNTLISAWYINRYSHINTLITARIYIYTCTYIHIYTHTDIHTCIFTYIHIHTNVYRIVPSGNVSKDSSRAEWQPWTAFDRVIIFLFYHVFDEKFWVGSRWQHLIGWIYCFFPRNLRACVLIIRQSTILVQCVDIHVLIDTYIYTSIHVVTS
jgi:hypothetical protein